MKIDELSVVSGRFSVGMLWVCCLWFELTSLSMPICRILYYWIL